METLRDPWPLNSFAIKAGIDLLSNKKFYEQWTRKIHSWINIERERVCEKLKKIDEIVLVQIPIQSSFVKIATEVKIFPAKNNSERPFT